MYIFNPGKCQHSEIKDGKVTFFWPTDKKIWLSKSRLLESPCDRNHPFTIVLARISQELLSFCGTGCPTLRVNHQYTRTLKRGLFQPILSRKPEPGHKKDHVIQLPEFISLLEAEEDYWAGEQHNTRLMISRLRKIFYDQWGWNKELIRGAANVECRYQVTIVDEQPEHGKPVRRRQDNTEVPKFRKVTYRNDDRVYGDTRVDQTPFIYQNDHQEVLMPDGDYCDQAHILAGLDAYNHPQIVSPFPAFLSFLDKLGPHVNSNMDIVTWLGDIASSAGDFLFLYLKDGKRAPSPAQEQHIIIVDAPGSDMLGDIDPYVIAEHYDVGGSNGMRYTEILKDYYFGEGSRFRANRFSTFAHKVGLEGWNGHGFSNEAAWLRYYTRQLRDNTSFQVFSLTDEKLHSVWLSTAVWFNGYKDVLKLEYLLKIFLKAVYECIKQEPQ
jgi:hypothetical protein